MVLIDGKAVSEQVKREIAAEVADIVAKGGKRPHLAAILVGHDGGSETYVAAKVKACEVCGFKSTLIRYESDVTEAELLARVRELNEDPDIDGFIVQLPLPEHLDDKAVIEAINPQKDVDAFHAVNVGKIMLGEYDFLPCTPAGVMEMLNSYNISVSGKNCVVIGRSNIVGKPMGMLLLHENGTVTICHSRTKNLAEICSQADILVAAVGRPKFVTADMVKDGVTVIDVGTTRVPDATKKSGFRLNGDVKFDEVAPKCAYITPVPGGVGPMTITMLLYNTLAAAERSVGL